MLLADMPIEEVEWYYKMGYIKDKDALIEYLFERYDLDDEAHSDRMGELEHQIRESRRTVANELPQAVKMLEETMRHLQDVTNTLPKIQDRLEEIKECVQDAD